MANTPIFTETIVIPGSPPTTITIDFSQEPNGSYDISTSLNGSPPVTVNVPCFMQGTHIVTAEGPVAVESLKIGDMVVTANGGQEPIRWIGRRLVSKQFADPMEAAPICIKAGALADGLPVRDLYVSPRHALFLDGCLIQAAALVNGTSIVRSEMPESFTYFHVEFATHDLLLAEGVPAETFVDNASRMGFDNWAEHEALGDTAPIVEMDLPRAQSGRQVPAATARKIAARAAAMFDAQNAQAA